MLARCGRVAHICEANFIGIQFAICFPCCNRTFLNFPVRIWKIREKQRQKFKQGNGAIAARWQAKAGVEPPFAGRFRPLSRRAFSHCFLYCLKNILHEKYPPTNPYSKRIKPSSYEPHFWSERGNRTGAKPRWLPADFQSDGLFPESNSSQSPFRGRNSCLRPK